MLRLVFPPSDRNAFSSSNGIVCIPVSGRVYETVGCSGVFTPFCGFDGVKVRSA